MTDEQWEVLAPIFDPPRTSSRGRPSKDARLMLDGVLWILRTGAPWRDVPEEFGKWECVYQRFRRWRRLGAFEKAHQHVLMRLG